MDRSKVGDDLDDIDGLLGAGGRAARNGAGLTAGGDEPRPRLHVPSAPFRPGDEPRFQRFRQQPEDLPRPDPLCPVRDTVELAEGLVRVLDDSGHALGAWHPHLDDAELLRGLETMVLVRAFDTRLMTMQRQGKLTFYLECKGEEAVAVAGGMGLAPQDLLFPTYRQQGLMFVRGASMVDMICHCIGNRRDNIKGRMMPIHYSARGRNLVAISSPVCTQFPQAVGAAMAAAMQGKSQVVAAWVGEGSSAEGDFHAAINFASVYKPPVVLNVVNNQWAISTHCNLASGGGKFALRGLPYNVASVRVDGNDFLAVHSVTAWAAERARRGGGPTLVELLTYRGAAHSSSDDPSRYRPGDEQRLWPGGDPIRRLADHLIQLDLWSEEQQRGLEQRADLEVVSAYKQAESFGTMSSGPFPPTATMFDDVYEDLPWHLREQRRELLGD